MNKDKTPQGDSPSNDSPPCNPEEQKNDTESAIDRIDRINRVVFQRILDRRMGRQDSKPTESRRT